MKQKLIIYIVLLGVLSSCVGLIVGILSANETYLTMERTICYGSCPIYRIWIFGNGLVVYWGGDFVKNKEIKVNFLVQDKIKKLVDAIESVDFYSLNDYVSGDRTDYPSVIITIKQNGRTKTVKHYLGDQSAPKKLIDFEYKIDEIADTR